MYNNINHEQMEVIMIDPKNLDLAEKLGRLVSAYKAGDIDYPTEELHALGVKRQEFDELVGEKMRKVA